MVVWHSPCKSRTLPGASNQKPPSKDGGFHFCSFRSVLPGQGESCEVGRAAAVCDLPVAVRRRGARPMMAGQAPRIMDGYPPPEAAIDLLSLIFRSVVASNPSGQLPHCNVGQGCCMGATGVERGNVSELLAAVGQEHRAIAQRDFLQ